VKKHNPFPKLVEELSDLDRRLFGSVAGVEECGAAECGDDPGQTMPATIGELHLVYELFKQRDSIHQQLSRLPPSAVPGRKDRIPWRRLPQDLRRLLAALIERGYIAKTSVDAILGHFNVKAPEPTELITWNDDQSKWTLGAFLAALADADCLGPVGKRRLLDTKTNLYTALPFPRPRSAAKWAEEHFGMKYKAFHGNCHNHKAIAERVVKTFANLLIELKIT
jgi:hypothetical protein